MINRDTLTDLQGEYQLGNVAYFESIESTNDLAAEWLKTYCPDKSLIVAGQQTRGKGRQGRIWYSPPNASLSISLILKTGFTATNPELISGLSAVAVCQAIAPFISIQPQIKWPNDVLIARKKVAGILVESQWEGGDIKGIVIGIGINVFPASLQMPEAPRFPATCLQDHSDQPISAKLVLTRVVELLLELNENANRKTIVEQWNHNLAFRNEYVAGDVPNSPEIQGRVKGVAPDGSLMLVLESGEIRQFQPNEIRISTGG